MRRKSGNLIVAFMTMAMFLVMWASLSIVATNVSWWEVKIPAGIVGGLFLLIPWTLFLRGGTTE